MTVATDVLLSWSSGKDAYMALELARADPRLNVVGLWTTLNEDADRVAMHGVRRRIVELQAASLGLPIEIVALPWPCSNEMYESRTRASLEVAKQRGIEGMVFGDLFLEDVRKYREDQLAPLGLSPHFPLWGMDTTALARSLVAREIRAHVACLDPKRIDKSMAGESYETLYTELTEGRGVGSEPGEDPIDLCGERGEFHTCVIEAPAFNDPIRIERGPVVQREGFVYADLIPLD